MSSTEPPRVNWNVQIVCKDCGAVYDVLSVDSSVDIINTNKGQGRMLLITIPNACPDCRNIRLAKPKDSC